MISHREAALTYLDCGYSVIPILANGTKRPQLKWEKYQTTLPTVLEVTKWWRTSPESGVGIICGAVSGNIEMLELEARANTGEALDKITAKMVEYGVEDFWGSITQSGYVAATPSGGLHLMYRITDHPVPGNTKIARRPATADELAENPRDKIKVLSETRGEGGYFVAAPTGGAVHKTRESWSLLAGKVGDKIWEISWATRCLIHDAIRGALDEMPAPVAPAPAAPTVVRDGIEPGTDYNNREQWRSLLESYGWTYESSRGVEQFWTRPGKDRRDGASATLYYQGSDNLYVFSSSTELPTDTPISKFAFYTFMEHNGDFSAAARALSRAGYGDRKDQGVDISDWFDIEAPSGGAGVGAAVESPTAAVEEAVLVPASKMIKLRERNETGVAELAVRAFGNKYRYVTEEHGWRVYRDGCWEIQKHSELRQDVVRLTRRILDDAEERLFEAESSGDKDTVRKAEKFVTFANACRQDRGIKAIMSCFAGESDISVAVDDFDAKRNLLCLDNGVLDMRTGAVRPHDPKDMLTKRIGVAHDPQARADEFEKYLVEVLPDPEYRAYIKRAVGMTLVADMKEAAFFVLHGPTGCGKSVFLSIMSAVLGDYAATAAPGTFKVTRGKSTDDGYELHRLRGARFASISETSESTSLNEELIKRVTGGDKVTSRAPYQDFMTWRPEFTMWMATNFPPRLNSDDNAIWRRVKPIHFPTSFYADGRTPDTGLTQRIIDNELPGVLNWILEGVSEYLEHGLGQPEAMKEAVEEYRAEVDPVRQFVSETVNEGILIEDAGSSMTTTELYRVYSTWSTDNGMHPLGKNRFGNRLETLGYPAVRGTGGIRLRSGLKLNAVQWIAGHQRPNWI